MNPVQNVNMAVEKQIIHFGETFCQIKMDSLIKLKDSTKRLLCLVEDIQSKTITSKTLLDDAPRFTDMIKALPMENSNVALSATDILSAVAVCNLETQANNLDEIYIQNEEDDCSVFKRLTRKCHCLNHEDYNDLIIHFNEDTKYFTSTFGEVIKNIRIVKKFLYMGAAYTKKALMFLNEGLSECPYNEKVEIIQACSYADVCNVFDEYSIVIICILWPCKNGNYGDKATQGLTAGLLHKLSQLEEGRRYLNFSSKITNDLKKVLRKESSKFESVTVQSLNATLNLLNPSLTRHINVTYYCKAEEGLGHRTLHALAQYRTYLTLDEVFTHLELLNNLSGQESGNSELRQYLPNILNLFKQLIMEYDNNEINILLSSILSNVMSEDALKKRSDLIKAFTASDMSTEPIQMIHAISQVPSKKNVKILDKSKLGLSPNKYRDTSKKRDVRGTIIVVPIERR